MNPITHAAQKVRLPLMRDVIPPKTQPNPSQTPPGVSLKPEIVSDIPVKNPIGSAIDIKPLPNPVVQVTKPLVETPKGDDEDGLDKILQDVNTSVKKSENTLEARFEHLTGVRKKVAIKKAKIDEAHNGAPPIAATILACMVALILTVSALLVFNKTS